MRWLRTGCVFLALFCTVVAQGQQGGQEPIKVFIDQDTSGPGGTDVLSIAMLLMAPNVEVVGIGVVAGDAWMDQALYHTLKIVEICGKPEVPVAAGSEEPLLHTRGGMRRRHEQWGPKPGDGWLGAWGDRVPPKETIRAAPGGPPSLRPVDKHAAELLIEMARKYPGELVLYTAGPLTNIALAVKLAPDIVGKIRKVYTMGGAIAVNEKFNFWWDAEAAAVHLRAEWADKEITPIDICHGTQMTPAIVKRIAGADTPLARYIEEAYSRYEMYGFMWDELAAAAIIDPKVITEKEALHLDCDFFWGPHYGKTVLWRPPNRPWWSDRPWQAHIALDRPRFEALFIDLMTRQPSPSN